MQGARRGPWWLPRASRATPQTPHLTDPIARSSPTLAHEQRALPTLRDRADFPSCGVVASLLGYYPTASAPPCLRGNLPRSRPREILRQAPRLCHALFAGCIAIIHQVDSPTAQQFRYFGQIQLAVQLPTAIVALPFRANCVAAGQGRPERSPWQGEAAGAAHPVRPY